jgi:hypothetical protein
MFIVDSVSQRPQPEPSGIEQPQPQEENLERSIADSVTAKKTHEFAIKWLKRGFYLLVTAIVATAILSPFSVTIIACPVLAGITMLCLRALGYKNALKLKLDDKIKELFSKVLNNPLFYDTKFWEKYAKDCPTLDFSAYTPGTHSHRFLSWAVQSNQVKNEWVVERIRQYINQPDNSRTSRVVCFNYLHQALEALKNLEKYAQAKADELGVPLNDDREAKFNHILSMFQLPSKALDYHTVLDVINKCPKDTIITGGHFTDDSLKERFPKLTPLISP